MKPSLTQYVLAIGAVALALGSAPARADCNFFDSVLGSVCNTAASFCPKTFVEARGQLIQISTHKDLFKVIGTTYGGDGESTFALPNLTASPSASFPDLRKLHSCVAVHGMYPPKVPQPDCPTEDPVLASICTTAAATCPEGFVQAKGQILPIASNAALFALIGTTFGGDGRTTFALPNLTVPPSGNVPVSQNPNKCIAVTGLFPPRE